jgi:ABC-2 type transport system ATP-binding protein
MIEAQQLQKSFSTKDAVRGVDLSVAKGEIYGFLGPNGAGKSTVVRMLCTLLQPSGGSAQVNGYDIVEQSEQVRLSIGVALQDAALDAKQTGREFLTLQGKLYGLTSAQVKKRIEHVSHIIDVSAIDRLIGTYSGGMKRRLDLAAALIHNPTVLFLDEPTTGLDPTSRIKVWDEVRRLNQELGMTIFLTTQYLEEADELADRVGIIAAGRLVAEDTPANLKRSIGKDVVIAVVDRNVAATAADVLRSVQGVDHVDVQGEEVIVSADDGSTVVGPVAIALNQASIQPRALTLRTPTLDDVFFHATGARMDDDTTDQSTDLTTTQGAK